MAETVQAAEPARQLTPPPVRTVARTALLPLAILVLVVAAWYLAVSRSANSLIPTPGKVAKAIPHLLLSGSAWHALATSDISLLIGYVIAVVIGVPVGLLMARSVWAETILRPYAEVAIVVPMAVMMPIVLVALGLTRTAQVVVIALFAVPFIVMTTCSGARVLPAEWSEMARVFGAGEAATWRHVLLPGSISSIVAGLRLGFAQALTGLLTVEMTLIALGIGRQMIHYQSHFEYGALFTFVGLLMAQSVVVISLFGLMERKVARNEGTL